MDRKLTTIIGLTMLAASVGACGAEEDEPPLTANEIENLATVNVAEAPALAEPPPMIVRSLAYRCDDGAALYVDVLTDENVLSVRDSRGDIPKLLAREGDAGPFTGENRSLSGAGEEVQYSAPERSEQSCRAAEG